MGCIALLIILLFPRITLALMWLFSNYLQRGGGWSAPGSACKEYPGPSKAAT